VWVTLVDVVKDESVILYLLLHLLTPVFASTVVIIIPFNSNVTT